MNMAPKWDKDVQFSNLLLMQIYYDVCKHGRHAKQSKCTKNESKQTLKWQKLINALKSSYGVSKS